jgi:hypothetical protein
MSYYGKPVPAGQENMGKAWKQDEISQLLSEIKDKKSTKEIATAHKRTEGGITSRLRSLAADYHIKESKPVNEIMILTGLSKESVIDAIAKKEYKNETKKKLPSSPAVAKKSESSELEEILKLLKTIEKRVSDYIKEKSIFDE